MARYHRKFDLREHKASKEALRRTMEAQRGREDTPVEQRCDKCHVTVPREELVLYGDVYLCWPCRSDFMMAD